MVGQKGQIIRDRHWLPTSKLATAYENLPGLVDRDAFSARRVNALTYIDDCLVHPSLSMGFLLELLETPLTAAVTVRDKPPDCP